YGIVVASRSWAHPIAAILFVSLLALGFIAVGIVGFYSRYKLLGQQLDVFDEGFLWSRHGEPVACRWGDIETVGYQASVQAGMSKEWAEVLVTLTLRNGEQVVLTEFDRMHAFVATLLEETAKRLLPDIRARIGAGETVVFGEFAISSEGLGY